MVVVTGAFSCLPDFSQIVAIAIAMGKVYLIVRALTSWYCEHIRGFFIENTRTVSVTELSSLLDYYPLCPYRYGITVNSNVCNAETFHFCHVE